MAVRARTSQSVMPLTDFTVAVVSDFAETCQKLALRIINECNAFDVVYEKERNGSGGGGSNNSGGGGGNVGKSVNLIYIQHSLKCYCCNLEDFSIPYYFKLQSKPNCLFAQKKQQSRHQHKYKYKTVTIRKGFYMLECPLTNTWKYLRAIDVYKSWRNNLLSWMKHRELFTSKESHILQHHLYKVFKKYRSMHLPKEFALSKNMLEFQRRFQKYLMCWKAATYKPGSKFEQALRQKYKNGFKF
nr:Caab020 [Calliteara abietis nucleopolyhedrovirus]